MDSTEVLHLAVYHQDTDPVNGVVTYIATKAGTDTETFGFELLTLVPNKPQISKYSEMNDFRKRTLLTSGSITCKSKATDMSTSG